jgi:membrane protease YdiL (CAAX protease family)
MLYPTALAWLYFVALAPKSPGTSTLDLEPAPGHNAMVLAAWIGGKAIQFLFPLVWVLAIERRRLQLPLLCARGLGNGLAFGLLVVAAIFILYHSFFRHSLWFQNTPGKIREKTTEFGMETPAKFTYFVSFIAVVHSLLEEYYWRWFVFGGLRQQLSFGLANLIASLAFMSFHVIDLAVFFQDRFWELALPFSACVGIGGAVFGWQYERTGSIYAPWLSHLLIDAGIMLVGYDLVFGQG